MKLDQLALWMSLALFFAPFPVAAQAPGELREVVSTLQKTFDRDAIPLLPSSRDRKNELVKAKFDGCKVGVRMEVDVKGNAVSYPWDPDTYGEINGRWQSDRVEYRFQLRDVNPDTIVASTRPAGLMLRCAKDAACVEGDRRGPVGGSNGRVSFFEFRFSDDKIRDQFKTNLVHAVELCKQAPRAR